MSSFAFSILTNLTQFVRILIIYGALLVYPIFGYANDLLESSLIAINQEIKNLEMLQKSFNKDIKVRMEGLETQFLNLAQKTYENDKTIEELFKCYPTTYDLFNSLILHKISHNSQNKGQK